jgi:choline dehydrogenase-like flavoprotein
MTARYPPGSVRALLATDYVAAPTRAALEQRLAESSRRLAFFTPEEASTLRAVVARLFAHEHEGPQLDLALDLDARLATRQSDGWRYDALPPDEQVHRNGLGGIEECAAAMFGSSFTALSGARQDEVLRAVQQGRAPGAAWDQLNSRRYFEELLAELSEYHYSHPLAQEEIGYVGMADQRGWQAIGLDRLDPHEPRPETGSYQPPAPASAPEMPEPPFEPPTPRFALDDEVDAVVIGTGAGGAPLLARLARAGMRVVALEAGALWQPARDFATDERAQEKLFWRDERLSAGDNPVAFGRNNSGIGVGGSTLHYTAYTPRPQPDDFHIRSTFGVGEDWPLSYADLAPYYAEVERFLGVSGPSPYPWGPPRPAYPLPPLPLNGAAELMNRGCIALGLRTAPAPNAALSAPYEQEGLGWRAACTNRGFCQAGCSVGAKGSMDVTYIPLALRAGAELRTGCFATQLVTDAQNRVCAVVYTQNGQEQRQKCRAVFLCAGAIETPRLLLINGLANGSGQVGRNFLAHPGAQVWGQFDADIRPYKGIPGALISEDTHRPADADFAGGYLLQSIGVMPVTYAGQLARGRGLWGPELRAHMRGYNHTAGINILGDCLPHNHNYLELADEKDARGLPKPRIHFTQGENERRMTAHALRLMRTIWQAAGAREVWEFPRHAHTIGTCRMGENPQRAVVNRDGRSFEVPNLYITDNSIFPSALSVNPALTIMALSLRIADQFVERARRRV